jgi:AcrR family transcriptional regulator
MTAMTAKERRTHRALSPAQSSTTSGRGARGRILETALKLFYAEGIRAVGIDRIIAESGTAKMSFYRHFPSKADLVCAFLDERHRRWMTWMVTRFETLSAKRSPKLPVVADVLREWFVSDGFHGCAFINILAETTASDTRERAIARAHKQELQDFLGDIAKADGHDRPSETARLALMIVEGAIVRAEMTGNPNVASDCKKLLAALR